MGLDIKAYKNMKKVENAERDAFGILESDDLLEIHQDIIDYWTDVNKVDTKIDTI